MWDMRWRTPTSPGSYSDTPASAELEGPEMDLEDGHGPRGGWNGAEHGVMHGVCAQGGCPRNGGHSRFDKGPSVHSRMFIL